MIHLVIGGARSGKSRFAESVIKLMEKDGVSVTYVATATADDEEMKKRIQHHQKIRPDRWALAEEPFYLGRIIQQLNRPNQLVLIDCLTLWMSNWLCAQQKEDRLDPTSEVIRINSWQDAWEKEKNNFVTALATTQADLVLVTNEVGSGVVPIGELSRAFVDQAGWMNQQLTEIVTDITFVLAGVPLALKTNKQFTSIVRVL